MSGKQKDKSVKMIMQVLVKPGWPVLFVRVMLTLCVDALSFISIEVLNMWFKYCLQIVGSRLCYRAERFEENIQLRLF